MNGCKRCGNNQFIIFGVVPAENVITLPYIEEGDVSANTMDFESTSDYYSCSECGEQYTYDELSEIASEYVEDEDE